MTSKHWLLRNLVFNIAAMSLLATPQHCNANESLCPFTLGNIDGHVGSRNLPIQAETLI
jgi:hypothetical protein